jgi:septum formation protein
MSPNRTAEKLILASSSPRRRELLAAAGYPFELIVPHDWAECGICSRETPPEMVARLACQKAADVAVRVERGIVIGCDTVAECCGIILGKPKNRDHAREMLELLRGREHHVYSGLCLHLRPKNEVHVQVDVTRLVMDAIADEQIAEYLETEAWEGKAGAFGYQDGLDWVHIRDGSESNVVGLPMELLARMLKMVGFEGPLGS